MTHRNYALRLMALPFIMMAAVAAANLVLDPQGVFGTNLFPQTVSRNVRYKQFESYLKDRDLYDALVFGSSRSAAIQISELERLMPGTRVAHMGAPAGVPSEHVAVLERIIEDKASARQRLSTVLIFLDYDLMRARPLNQQGLSARPHPTVSGESRFQFFLQHVVAVQWDAWREVVRPKRNAPRFAGSPPSRAAQHRSPAETSRATGFAHDAAIVLSAADVHAESGYDAQKISAIERGRIMAQISTLRRIAALCRRHDVRLIVAANPLNRQVVNQTGSDLIEYTASLVAEALPVWDFGHPDWLSDRPELWEDVSHFSAEVGRAMLGQLFGRPAPGWPYPFGRARNPAPAT